MPLVYVCYRAQNTYVIHASQSTNPNIVYSYACQQRAVKKGWFSNVSELHLDCLNPFVKFQTDGVLHDSPDEETQMVYNHEELSRRVSLVWSALGMWIT